MELRTCSERGSSGLRDGLVAAERARFLGVAGHVEALVSFVCLSLQMGRDCVRLDIGSGAMVLVVALIAAGKVQKGCVVLLNDRPRRLATLGLLHVVLVLGKGAICLLLPLKHLGGSPCSQ